jgi:hypothetical protein
VIAGLLCAWPFSHGVATSARRATFRTASRLRETPSADIMGE